jgi:hypothetical protein
MNITSVDLSPVITAMVDGQIIDGEMK